MARDLPGIPRGKLPSVREVDATSGAPHTAPPPAWRPPPPPPQHTVTRPGIGPEPAATREQVDVVAIQGNGWRMSTVALAAILSTVGSIVGPRIAGPQSTPADIQMVQRMDEFDARLRSIERRVTELGAKSSNSESLSNELLVEIAKTNRELRKLKASEP